MTITPTVTLQTWPGELRALGRLAWPVVVGQLGLMAFGVADVVMAGQAGEGVLAAVSVAHIWAFGVLVVALGVLRGLDPVFAQAHGAGQREVLAGTLAQGMVLATLLSVPTMGLLLVAEPVLIALDQPPEVIKQAALYCQISAISVLPTLWFQVASQQLQGQGIMRPAMVVVWLLNIVNILLNGVFMLGWGGGWELGAVGCAWSTTLGRFLMLPLLMLVAWRALKDARPTRSQWVDLPRLRRVARLGLPVGGQHFLEVWAFNATGLMVGWLGATAIAGHTIAMTVASVTFMVPYGISAAASTRVGNLAGAGQPWGRAAAAALGIGTSFMATTAVVLVVVPHLIVAAFTQEAEVAAVALLALPLAAAFQLFDGVQIVSNGVLRGVGDVDFPAVAQFIGFWVLGLPLGYTLGIHQGGGVAGVWAGLLLGLMVVSMLLLGRVLVRVRRGALVVV